MQPCHEITDFQTSRSALLKQLRKCCISSMFGYCLKEQRLVRGVGSKPSAQAWRPAARQAHGPQLAQVEPGRPSTSCCPGTRCANLP